MNAEAAPAGEWQPTLLCVDDERNILNALRRLFRPDGYRVLVAEGGPRGLEILEREPVDLVISDMRMPEMNGAEFLAEVAARWPDTVRILLTGYADLSSTIDAVNRGQIYRYVSKPWDDEDLRLTVRRALETLELARERRRLEGLTRRQNEELRRINATLEEKVRERTEKIRRAARIIEKANADLRRAYQEAVRVFSSLVELREGTGGGHGRRVADLAQRVAARMGLDEDEQRLIHNAGLLHDVGKITLPDALLRAPYELLEGEDRRRYERHPLLGEQALSGLEPLARAGRLVRAHHESWDGGGYPDGLAGEDIPQGARILRVVEDFDELLSGMLAEGRFRLARARERILAGSGTEYDPEVVKAFVAELRAAPPEHVPRPSELVLPVTELRPGMVLTRDLVSRSGLLLLAAGHVLREGSIERIRAFEHEEGEPYTVHVRLPEPEAVEEEGAS